ncbi:NAD(P)-binding oxidoreductase [Fluviicola sp.]|uniref:NAD(P)-binding oxidoreductase n=1 Tax=Fluviicola sp. TaxID=1917219 RepID=UPI00260F23BD|nr:NAD(P)-binding oxidoreductase [Fluviicola sp.]
MTTLVVGASGATGKLLVEQLLKSGQRVKVIVRSESAIPDHWSHSDQLEILQGNIAEIPVEKLSEYLRDYGAVACCLGHNMSLKGIYGKPRKLVRDSVSLLCRAIEKNAPEKPVKFVLMNTAGNRNRDLNEPISVGERIVTVLLRLLLPPHPDNEQAADYLRTEVGQNNPFVEWAAVRPDTLIDEGNVTEYSLHPSPVRSALFSPGKTSRINVANLMSRLITDENLWINWKGQMPVIYNQMIDSGK